MLPIPKQVLDDTAELLEQSKAQDVRVWLEGHTAPAPKIESGSLATAVRRAAAEALGIEERAADAFLKAAGCRTRRIGAGVFMTWLYPDTAAHKAVKLLA
jgi:hypothetical protein